MSWDRIQAEKEALESMLELYASAAKCQELFERAHMAMPEPLSRFLAVTPSEKKSIEQPVAAHIPPPDRPIPPEGAKDDWIWIEVRDAILTSVVLAVLRQAKTSVRARDVIEQVLTFLPNTSRIAVANAGTRLEANGIISRTDEGWKLVRPEMAGLIKDNLLWGLPSIFQKQELAAHRREAILHILKHFSGGLQTVQIVEQLKNCPWVRAPVNKDLAKADMEELRKEGKVKHRGHSKKWVLVLNEKGE